MTTRYPTTHIHPASAAHRKQRGVRSWATITTQAIVLVTAWLLAGPVRPAAACGCFHSPEPPPTIEGDSIAVNQQAEQIVFEVGDGKVTVHVLLRYEGDPDKFAWLLPVPDVPDLDVSYNSMFAILDEGTRPVLSPKSYDICPVSPYVCKVHPDPCPPEPAETADAVMRVPTMDASTGGAGGAPPPPVTLLKHEVVGSYDVVVFAANEAPAAVQWLVENGFLVNPSMTPYVQPYLDAGMVIVAAKLVKGATTDEIRPLRLTYPGDHPMIPLRMTAIAAEPHLTVTAWVFADRPYVPAEQSLIDIPEERLSVDPDGRLNYPMVLARAIDEAGGDAFFVEYAGPPTAAAKFTHPYDPCCVPGDVCGIGGDGECQCPGADFDHDDCAAVPELLDGIDQLERIEARHTYVTRLTTRLSPEEMTFDPVFVPDEGHTTQWKVYRHYDPVRYHLDSCADRVVDTAQYDAVVAQLACTSVYCGVGECVVTDDGPGCACPEGWVARRFIDLDGLPSVTCTPAQGTVDLGMGIDLPDVCANVDCGPGGTCHEVGGFPTCECLPAFAGRAPLEGEAVPPCQPIAQGLGSPGAENFSKLLKGIKVCAPPPPPCPADGWYEFEQPTSDATVLCPDSIPPDDRLVPPPPPDPAQVCGTSGSSGPLPGDATSALPPSADADAASPDQAPSTHDAASSSTDSATGGDGSGCRSAQGSPEPLPWLLLIGLAAALLFRRHRHLRTP